MSTSIPLNCTFVEEKGNTVRARVRKGRKGRGTVRATLRLDRASYARKGQSILIS